MYLMGEVCVLCVLVCCVGGDMIAPVPAVPWLTSDGWVKLDRSVNRTI
jgi:hypothetical protein